MIAVAAATGVAALALAGWSFAPRTDAEGRSLGPRMAISLVAPKEPEITPGNVLEVGTLNDGFDRAVLDRAPEIDDPTWMPPDAYAGADDGFGALPRMPMPRPVAMDDFPPPAPPPSAERDPLRDGSRWFGLDRMRDAMADARADRPRPRDRYAEMPRYEGRPRYSERPRYGEVDEPASQPSSGPRPYYSSDDRYGPE
jgi:hypothetical protein